MFFAFIFFFFDERTVYKTKTNRTQNKVNQRENLRCTQPHNNGALAGTGGCPRQKNLRLQVFVFILTVG